MWVSWANTMRLGFKELRSLRGDPVLLALIFYAFTYGVYKVATGEKFEVYQAAVAIVDEDHSQLSRRIAAAILEPTFKKPVAIEADAVDGSMDRGEFVFALEIPTGFESDIRSGRRPTLQIDVDATAMSQAGNGAVILKELIARELRGFAQGLDTGAPPAIEVVVRAKFNPNGQSEWFTSIMQIITYITMLSVILSGAAIIREREHGTIEHLLVMPVTPAEVMLSKIWANGLVIVAAALLSLVVIAGGLLGVPVFGSLALFTAGALLYQFSVTALGILLATFTSSMQQFGLLVLPILVSMALLSGAKTPLESMPAWLQTIMQVSPSTHFVSFSQAVLTRNAGLSIVWPYLLTLALIGLAFFAIALLRFRRSMLTAQ
jgi:ABC-2 type transport system permease protein